MKLLVLIFLVASLQQAAPTDSVSLQDCYERAYQHYPTAKNVALQEKITGLNVQIAHTGYFPNVEIGGKASYQSEVTNFSLPAGGGPPGVSKDQYEASLSVTQNIFKGGAIGIQKKLAHAKGQQEIHSTEVELHQIRSQVNQVYFGILLSQQQLQVNGLQIKDLQKRLSSVRSQVEHGIMLPSQRHILQAELIKARQDSAGIQSNIRAGYQVLSELTGSEIDTNDKLTLPEVAQDYQSLQPQRPEYDLFQSTSQTLQEQIELTNTKRMPAVSAFGTAAYGRPGLNFLNDDFHDYYIVGLRFRWNIRDFLNADREKQVLNIQQQKVDQNRQAFTRQLQASLDRLREQIETIRENIERDRKIIELREQVVKETASQLDNGVITATEYVTQLNRANAARLSLFINRVQLSQAQIEYLTTLGLPLQN
ncbi:MAG: TolC family protein [Balneolaceae bacterium]|nr:TolC family protein [Balneolaceae bacterium]